MDRYEKLAEEAIENVGIRDKQITTLRAQLASREAQYHQGHNQRERVLVKVKAQVSNLKSRGEDDRRAIGRLVEQITTLRAQLERHGGHTAECASIAKRFRYNPGDEPYGTHTVWHKECDCGWAEIAKGKGV